jgi:hypothetical protein
MENSIFSNEVKKKDIEEIFNMSYIYFFQLKFKRKLLLSKKLYTYNIRN